MTTENFPTEEMPVVVTADNTFVPKAEYDKALLDLENARANSNAERNTAVLLNNRMINLKSEVKEFIVNGMGGVSNDDLRELAGNLGIDLTRRVSFTVTATFSCSADVEYGVDLDDLVQSGYELNATLDYNGDDLDNFDFDSHDVEVSDVVED
jgi:hypothetical protein